MIKRLAGQATPVGVGRSVSRPSMDFETYSEAGFIIGDEVKGAAASGKGGLPVVGTPNYAAHNTAEALCLYYDLKDGRGARGWIPGGPEPLDLIEHIRRGGEIEGHNVTFEFYVWNLVCVPRYGWPGLQLTQCYCSMAKARRYSLPGALGTLAKVLGTTPKDPRGGQLVQRLTRPHTPTKNRPGYRRTPATDWSEFVELYKYCEGDVVAEDEVSARVPELSPAERDVWLVDQRINYRGVRVDLETLDAALVILAQTEVRFTEELHRITKGAVGSVSEVAKMLAWLTDNNVHLPDLTADSVAAGLESHLVTAAPRRALEIRATLGSANVKKLRTIKLQVSSDGRLRDQYMYCGADRTGRWSSGGAQLQNMTAKGPKSCECEACGQVSGQLGEMVCCPRCGAWLSFALNDWTQPGVEAAIQDIRQASLDVVLYNWGDDPLAVLCGVLRGLFVPAPDHDFICVDYSAVEAVVAACLARCQWRIDVFSGHGKIYEQSAANATGIPFEAILAHKRDTGAHHPARKTIGKVRELAGGYGGWIGAWKNFGADAFMTDDEIKVDVLKWRDESPEIVDMWGGQYRWCGPGKWDYRPELFGLEGCAIQAILNPGQCFSHIDITYGVVDDVLHCRLPSGRFLYYHRPRLANVQDKLRRGPSLQITFEGFNTDTKRGSRGWLRMETYGGRLFENVVQAVARDIQAAAMVRCEAAGYLPVMHTHDEITAEVPVGWGSIEGMTEIMIERPSWATWWPIRADGWRDFRYKKD